MDLREALNRQWAPHGRQRSSTAATRSAGGFLVESWPCPLVDSLSPPLPFTFYLTSVLLLPMLSPIISSNGSRSCPGTMPLWGLLCRLPETPWPGSLELQVHGPGQGGEHPLPKGCILSGGRHTQIRFG